MTRPVRILRRAQADVIEICNYVERDSPRAAKRLVDKLLDRIDSLASLPERGVTPKDDYLRARGFRVIIEGECLIFYKMLRRQIRVYRVLHGRRKYRHLL